MMRETDYSQSKINKEGACVVLLSQSASRQLASVKLTQEAHVQHVPYLRSISRKASFLDAGRFFHCEAEGVDNENDFSRLHSL